MHSWQPMSPHYCGLVLEKSHILTYKFCRFVKIQSQPQIENDTSQRIRFLFSIFFYGPEMRLHRAKIIISLAGHRDN